MAAGAVLVAALVLGWKRGSGWWPSDHAAGGVAVAYVSDAACAECHAKESREWHGSHHRRAMQSTTTETVLGDFRDATFSQHGGYLAVLHPRRQVFRPHGRRRWQACRLPDRVHLRRGAAPAVLRRVPGRPPPRPDHRVALGVLDLALTYLLLSRRDDGNFRGALRSVALVAGRGVALMFPKLPTRAGQTCAEPAVVGTVIRTR